MNTETTATPVPQNAVKIKLDVIFKKLFSEHEDLLRGLLTGLLNLPNGSIKNLRLKNAEILPESATGKFVRMDLSSPR